ncbi:MULTISPECIES: hypothetical protein [unclassified Nocardioides]|uniref:hypothetical protein n=1 Tax=unclassified Nocardioides TaxID=2615069 RepID=UPI0009EFB787|nr:MULTISPECIES: hypothetical protein [unclassified Nocardioides]GAW47748.1 Peptide methionine sulfoxide reductase MsrA [Nocardioides sp. PD653-B2]GAW56206.1 Peptide methionine sulfoxide reductase MsrA [Nocardioides sp. PD653]
MAGLAMTCRVQDEDGWISASWTSEPASDRGGYYVHNNQQYLAKNPFGYRCHSNTGVKFPATA